MQALLNQSRATLILVLTVVFGQGLFGYGVGVAMAPYVPVVGDRLGTLTCLQMAFTEPRALSVIQSFSPAEQQAVIGLMIPGDLFLAFGYGFTLVGLLGLLALRVPPQWRRWGALLMWAPLLASCFDMTEDLAMVAMLGGVLEGASTTGAVLPLVASIAASLKYFLLAVVTPGWTVFAISVAVREDRRAGAWVVYVLAGLMALSMLPKPLMEIPACF